MTADWVVPISRNPPIVGVSISPKRYSYKLARERGELVISVPKEEMLDRVWICGIKGGRNYDKSKLFEFYPSKKVSVPSIKGAFANLECKVLEVREYGDHALFVCEVVNVDPPEFREGEIKSLILHVREEKFRTVGGREYRMRSGEDIFCDLQVQKMRARRQAPFEIQDLRGVHAKGAKPPHSI